MVNNNNNNNNDVDDLTPSSKKHQPNGTPPEVLLLEDSSRRSRMSTSFRDWSQRFRTVVGQHTGTYGSSTNVQCLLAGLLL